MNLIKDNYIFIFIITGDYKNFHRRSFIENFAKFVSPNNVIVIDRPKDLTFSLFFRRNRFKNDFYYNIKNIYVIRPTLIIHDQISFRLPKIIVNMNMFFFRSYWKKYTSKFLNKKKITIIMHPSLSDYLDVINPDCNIYDMYDEFLYPNYSTSKEKKEYNLIKKSNLVCVVSNYLKEKKEKIYKTNKFFLLNNAIDLNLFYYKNKNEYNNKKVVGFVGNIKNYIDFNLIQFLAQNRPDITFIIIGFNPNQLVKKEIKLLKNIIFKGSQEYEKLPNLIREFKVGIIPYKVEDTHIKSISPMKLYEYLACNSFILSSPIPEVLEFKKNNKLGKYVEVANNYDEFLQKLNLLLEKENFELTKEEIYTISWEKRFSDLFKKLHKLGIVDL